MSTNINTNLFSRNNDPRLTDFSEFSSIAVEPISNNLETTSIGIITASDGGIVNLTPHQDPGNGEESNPPYDLGELDLNNGGGLRIDQTVGGSDPVDLYQFTLNDSGGYQFTLDNLSADANIVLFDSNGVVIEHSELDGTQAESFNVDLDAGTYLLGVYSNDGVDTSYNVTVQDVPNPNSIPPEQPPINPNEPDPPFPLPTPPGPEPPNPGNPVVIPDQDPGFSFDEAYDLGILNSSLSIQEVVGGNDQGDIYQFTVDNAGEYSFSLNGLTADAHMGILDSNGNLITASENSGTAEEFISTPLSEGTYYLSVITADGVTTNYNLNFFNDNLPQNPPGPEPPNPGNPVVIPDQDPGFSFDEAYDLGILNSSLSIQEVVGGNDQGDIYQFTVDNAGEYSFSLNGLTADAHMGILDSNGNLITASENSGTAEEFISTPLSEGTYYLSVITADGVTTNYNLNFFNDNLPQNPPGPEPPNPGNPVVIPDQDPGWNFTTAYDLGEIDGSLTVQDAVNGSDRVDVYQFSLDESGDYIFTLDELSADVDMGLYSSYGELLDSSYNVGSLSESINMDLDAGTYFVGVMSYDLMDTNYELTIAEDNSIV